jgi:hypothetical protein
MLTAIDIGILGIGMVRETFQRERAETGQRSSELVVGGQQ